MSPALAGWLGIVFVVALFVSLRSVYRKAYEPQPNKWLVFQVQSVSEFCDQLIRFTERGYILHGWEQGGVQRVLVFRHKSVKGYRR